MIDFSKDKPDEAPRNLTTALTGNGNTGKWVVLYWLRLGFTTIEQKINRGRRGRH